MHNIDTRYIAQKQRLVHASIILKVELFQRICAFQLYYHIAKMQFLIIDW